MSLFALSPKRQPSGSVGSRSRPVRKQQDTESRGSLKW